MYLWPFTFNLSWWPWKSNSRSNPKKYLETFFISHNHSHICTSIQCAIIFCTYSVTFRVTSRSYGLKVVIIIIWPQVSRCIETCYSFMVSLLPGEASTYNCDSNYSILVRLHLWWRLLLLLVLLLFFHHFFHSWSMVLTQKVAQDDRF